MNDVTSTDNPKNLNLLAELMLRGKNYRQEHETTVFGGDVTLIFQPVPDEEYMPILGVLEAKFDVDEAEAIEDIEGALDDADGEAMDMDLSGFDREFVELMADLCLLGIDYEQMGGDAETLKRIIKGDDEEMPAVGGYVLEWGMEIMDLTGNLADAKKFR